MKKPRVRKDAGLFLRHVRESVECGLFMNESDAIQLAREYILEQQLDVIGSPTVRYLTFAIIEEAAIPLDIIETYRSVKSTWKNRRVVSFEKRLPPGVVESPGQITIYVSDEGELSLPHRG